MKKLLVRPARSFDLTEVERLARRPFAARWSRDAYAEEAERTDSIFLVADDGATRGYLVARLFEDEVQLLDLAVETDGQGVGRALWDGLLSLAKTRGAKKLTLELSNLNSRALLFYKRAGAAVVGTRPKFYNDGSDAILMDLSIP